MYSLRILLILFLTNTIIFSQNLVLNPSFEENTLKQHYCPTLLYLLGVSNWHQPTYGSVDYYKKGNICKSWEYITQIEPKSGNYYVGLYGICSTHSKRYREYIQGTLINKLEKNKEYKVDFYIALAQPCVRATNSISVYFGDELLNKKNQRRLKLIPQVSTDLPITQYNWQKVTFIYKATGEEKYITIGNFNKYSKTAKITLPNLYLSSKSIYYFIDDVSVIEVTPEFKSITREETIKVDTISISKLPNVGDKIIMSSLRFRTNQHNLIDSTHKELDKIVTLLTVNPFLKVEISGHTDSIGNPKTNIILSERRAETVKQYLLEKGISINRISTSGKGSSEPISTNSTEEGRAMNRRIEITITDVFEYKE